MKELLFGYVIQLLWTVGVLVLFGLILELTTGRFLKNTGKGGRTFFIATGFLGTPVHELSHAVMCVLFRHRIKRICLFSPNDANGTLGYVEHAYNPKNLYQRVGNFFIGIAPMLGGGVAMVLLMYFLLPETYVALGESTAALYSAELSPVSLETYRLLFHNLWLVLSTLFAPSQLLRPAFWLFFVLALMIAMHMDISTADLKTAMVGFWVFAALLLAVDGVLYYAAPTLFAAFTTTCLSVASLALVLMLPATVLMLLALLVSYLIRAFQKDEVR